MRIIRYKCLIWILECTLGKERGKRKREKKIFIDTWVIFHHSPPLFNTKRRPCSQYKQCLIKHMADEDESKSHNLADISLPRLFLCLPISALRAFLFPRRMRHWRWNSTFTSTSRHRVKLHHSNTEAPLELLQGQKHQRVRHFNMLLSPAERGAEWGRIGVETSDCVSTLSPQWRCILSSLNTEWDH